MRTILFSQLLICFFLSTLFSQTNNPSSAPLFLFKAMVQDASGKHLPGASIKVMQGSQIIMKGVTAHLGTYTLELPTTTVQTGNEYQVIISMKGKITNKIGINTFIPEEDRNKYHVTQHAFDLVVITVDESPEQIVREYPGGKLEWNKEKHTFTFTQTYAKVSVLKERGNKKSFTGKIYLNYHNDEKASSLKISLFSAQGTLLQTILADSSGYFDFKNLDPDHFFSLKIESDDPAVTNCRKIYLADSKGRVVRVARNKKNFFVFENLPFDINMLSTLNEKDLLCSIAGNLLVGGEQIPVGNMQIVLKNEKGEIVHTTTTNNAGSFTFANLPTGQNFTIAPVLFDPKLLSSILTLMNKNGVVVYTSNGKVFQFQLLSSDKNTMSLLKVDDSKLFCNLKGKLISDKSGQNAIANARIFILSNEGKMMATITDSYGNFIFDSLPAGNNYRVILNETDSVHVSKNVLLSDTKGNFLGMLKSAEGKIHRLEILPVEEQPSFADIYYHDPWKKADNLKAGESMIIVEDISYEYSKWTLLPEANRWNWNGGITIA